MGPEGFFRISDRFSIRQDRAKNQETQVLAQIGVARDILRDLFPVNHRFIEPRGIASGKNLLRQRERRCVVAANGRREISDGDRRQRRLRAVNPSAFVARSRWFLHSDARNFLRWFGDRAEIFRDPAIKLFRFEIAHHDQGRVIGSIEGGMKRAHLGEL